MKVVSCRARQGPGTRGTGPLCGGPSGACEMLRSLENRKKRRCNPYYRKSRVHRALGVGENLGVHRGKKGMRVDAQRDKFKDRGEIRQKRCWFLRKQTVRREGQNDL